MTGFDSIRATNLALLLTLTVPLGCDPGSDKLAPEKDPAAPVEGVKRWQAGGSPSTTGSGGGAGASSAPNDSPVGHFGQLSIEGSKIVDQSGEPVQLKGPSSMWLNWENDGFAENADALVWMRDNWNMSIIRAAMGIEPGGAYISNPERAMSQVTTIVDNAIAAGVYVIIDWHDHNAHDNRALAEEFFSEMAQRYGDVPNVLYEPFNEPQQVSWTGTVKPYHEAIVERIREYDEDNIIILGTPNWSQYVDEAASSPVNGSNIAYTLHFYSCSHGDSLRVRGQRAMDAGKAVFVTEWGATNADGGLDGEVCESSAQSWTNWMKSNGVSWTAWKLDNCTDSSCYFPPNGAPVDGGWTENDLSGHGPFVVKAMQE